MSNTPSDAEILALAQQHLKAFAQFSSGEVWFEGEVEFARAVLAKWGTPQPAPAPLSDEREAFESTWENLYGKKPVLWDTAFKEAKMDVPAHSAGKYFYRDAQAAWKAWQARAALAAQGGK